MNNNREESIWSVDLGSIIEECFVKICSGKVTGEEDGAFYINFMEAAFLLEKSVEVYSRRVEYLYRLVLHVLDFLLNKRQQDQLEKASIQLKGGSSEAVNDEDNDPFYIDDVPVDPKNCLDVEHINDDAWNRFVKPPAILDVQEGDWFDTIRDFGELDPYLLATHDLFRNFILLDPCDARAVDDFLTGDKADVSNSIAHKGGSFRSKIGESFLNSPTRRSGGVDHNLPLEEHGVYRMRTSRSPGAHHNFDNNWPDAPPSYLPENDYHDHMPNDGFQEPMDGSDSNDDHVDPWKPLYPHERGSFKVKPFKKGKKPQRQEICSTKQISLATEFPVAKMHGPLNPDLREMWEAQQLHDSESLGASQSPSLYEKLRQSLTIGGYGTSNPFSSHVNGDGKNKPEKGVPDLQQARLPHNNGQDPPQANLAETNKQAKLATGVPTREQGIKRALEEEDLRTLFSIDEYRERVLKKLFLEADGNNCMSFSDVVRGQKKHDVARTFIALMQLANNRYCDLVTDDSSGQSVCYNAQNPFYVKLLFNDRRQEQVHVEKESEIF